MFEALVTLCALSGTAEASPICRPVLLPGYAAQTQADCEAALRDAPPGWLATAGEWTASCAPRPLGGLDFSEIAPGVFAHRGQVADPDAGNLGDVANIAFVVGTSGIAVIDAGGSRFLGEQVYLAIRARSALPISYLILTHMHPDHVFGAEALREAGAEIIGHSNLPRALSDRAESWQANFATLIGAEGFIGSRIVGPDRVLAEPGTIDLGGRVLQLVPRPVSHTATDLTVFDLTTGVLFSGDLLFHEHTPALDGSLRGWRAVLADLQAEPARRVVPGHGGPVLPWPEAGDAEARYLRVLEADTRAALDEGLTLAEATDVIGQSESKHWQLFEAFNARNATVAFTEMEWD